MHCHERREANVATTFYDSTTGYYTRKIKTLTGRYRKIKLGKPGTEHADPNVIPPDIFVLGDRWQDEHHVVSPIPKVETQTPSSGHQAGPPPSWTPTARRIDLFDKLASFYRQQGKTLRPKSLEKLRLVIDRFSGWCKRNGIRYLDEVRAGVVSSYLEWEQADYERRGKTIAPQTLKAYLSLLGKCWSQAIRYELYHGQNPIRAVCHDLPSSNITSRPESLTPEEIAALMEAIAYRKARPFERGPSSRLPQWVEDIVVVMLNTGLRINSTVHLRFDWIKVDKLTVPVEYSKSKKAYSTLVNAKVRAILERRRTELGPDAERVFPEPKGPAWVYSRLNYLAKSLVKAGKWKRDMGHYNHVLRHTFITEQLKAGVPLVMVSKLAGHTSVAMTQRYDQSTYDDAIRWALDKGVSL